jgi:hypothetical protein
MEITLFVCGVVKVVSVFIGRANLRRSAALVSRWVQYRLLRTKFMIAAKRWK